jgi:FG-GAP-like repeat/ASPIC and UnbV
MLGIDTSRFFSTGVLFTLIGGVTFPAYAVDPLSFNNESLTRGINFRLGFNYHQVGAGNALSDFDNDGDLDILIAGGQDGAFGLYENDGTGNFTDRIDGSGFTDMYNASGLSVVDYDNDGDLDVHVPGWFVPSRLYRNDGNFTFTDVAPLARVHVNAPSLASAWGDYDADGDLDLYACVRTFTDNVEIENKLYRNNGDGTFTDVAVELGVEAPGDPSCLATFFDYDRDGDEDIYIGTDKGSKTDPRMLHNKLYRNEGDGTFTNVTHEANAAAYLFCMGIAVGDIDFDGYFDMYLTNVPAGNKLLVYDGVSAYEDQTSQAGMESHITGWGTVFADFDHDTELDTYVCNINGPNRLYRGGEIWPIIDEGPGCGVAIPWDSYCVSVGDIDGDNDIDMLVGNSNRRINLFINNSVGNDNNNWARFNVVGNNANVFGIGTIVDINTKGKSQSRIVRSGENYKSQNEYTLDFGLAQATIIDSAVMTYTGGETRSFTNIPINTNWTLYPESLLGDPNGNGIVDLEELSEAISLRTGPGGVIEPGQEIYDMDGDFDIDNDDLIELGLLLATPSVR